MIFSYAKNDIEWSIKVRERHDGYCILCGRPGQAAHIFGRGIKSTRLIIENGVCLCGQKCHRWFDRLSAEDRKRIAVLFIGFATYEALEKESKVLNAKSNR